MNRADIVAKSRFPAIVLVVFWLMLAVARGATPQKVAPVVPAESGWVRQLPAQTWQFLLETPHRAKDSVWKQLGLTALFCFLAMIMMVLGGGGLGSRHFVAAFICGGVFGGGIFIVSIVYGGLAPFVVIPWGIFIFARGFKSGRRSPEKWFYPIYDSESRPTKAAAAETWSWFPPVTAKDFLRPSVIALGLSNLIPVFGVLALGWSVFPLLMLYWMENVVIGCYNVLRMAWCTGKGNVDPWWSKLIVIPFFCGHYGGFCAVHGLMVYSLFAGKSFGDSNVDMSFAAFGQVMVRYQLGWALLGLVVSHGVSFVDNYLLRGERRRAHFGELMFQPYVRVVVLHLVLLLGAAAGFLLGSPTYALVLLVLMKIVLDLRAHLVERDKFATGGDKRDRKSALHEYHTRRTYR